MHGQDQTLKNVSNTLDNVHKALNQHDLMTLSLGSIPPLPRAKTSFYYSPKQLLQLLQHLYPSTPQ